MRVAGRLDSYDNIPCEVKCVPVFIPYYFVYKHYQALDDAKGQDYWAHIAFLAAELIPFLNFIPFAVDYFAGKKVSEVSFSREASVSAPLIQREKRKSIKLGSDLSLQLFLYSISTGNECDAIRRFNDNKEKLSKNINIPFQLGIEDTFGNTALHFACYMRMNALIQLLVEAGAKIDQTNDADKSPLDCYTFEGDLKELFENDASYFTTPRPKLDYDKFDAIKPLITPETEEA